MNRKRLLVGGLLTLAIVIASTSVSWSRPVVPDGATRGTDPPSTSGIAGPAGPQQISPVAAYFKRVTYQGFETTQSQTAGIRLPAGRYLVEVVSPGSVDASDCLGVSFPLVPPHDANPAYTGYVTVAPGGGDAEVSCFQEPQDPTEGGSYELYFFPVG
jgi:hypothetical protein